MGRKLIGTTGKRSDWLHKSGVPYDVHERHVCDVGPGYLFGCRMPICMDDEGPEALEAVDRTPDEIHTLRHKNCKQKIFVGVAIGNPRFNAAGCFSGSVSATNRLAAYSRPERIVSLPFRRQRWPLLGIVATRATRPPPLPLTHTTPLAPNRTTKDTTTTAPRTPTPTATLMPRTIAFTTTRMENAITIKMATILTVRYPSELFATRRNPQLTLPSPHPDTDSENDGYGQRYEPSSESLAAPRMGVSDSSTPTIVDFSNARDSYPAWSTERQIPLSKEEIEDIFLDLTQKFGFQRDSMRNMVSVTQAPTHWRQVIHPLSTPYQFDFTMQLLDSRASRMSPNQALLTLHADYIGGQNANYRKWYFAAQLDLDDAVGQTQNPGLRRFGSVKSNKNLKKGSSVKSLNTATERWRQAMNNMSQYDRMRQIALYLLCWGEAAQVRFVPECLCFIFKCADDYYRSPECQNRVQPVKEGLYLQTVIKPLYLFIRDQGYEVIDGRFVRREKDHADIIGYDDVNQLFWYPEGIARIVLNDNVSSPP